MVTQNDVAVKAEPHTIDDWIELAELSRARGAADNAHICALIAIAKALRALQTCVGDAGSGGLLHVRAYGDRDA